MQLCKPGGEIPFYNLSLAVNRNLPPYNTLQHEADGICPMQTVFDLAFHFVDDSRNSQLSEMREDFGSFVLAPSPTSISGALGRRIVGAPCGAAPGTSTLLFRADHDIFYLPWLPCSCDLWLAIRTDMTTSRLALLLCCLLTRLAAGHVVLTYPGWRGNNLITNATFPFGMQWMYPCTLPHLLPTELFAVCPRFSR